MVVPADFSGELCVSGLGCFQSHGGIVSATRRGGKIFFHFTFPSCLIGYAASMKVKIAARLLPSLALAGTIARAQLPAGENRVNIVTNGEHRVIIANGLPDHTPGQFPNRGNPNTIAAQNYTLRMTLQPQTNAVPQSAQRAWFGVALNGVPFELGTVEFWHGERAWNYEAQGGFIDLGLDANNAHVQPNGAYHYHGLPTGLMTRLGGDAKKMLLVGYAADGFPIYTSYAYRMATNAASPLRQMHSSWRLKKGDRPGGPGGRLRWPLHR